MSFVYRTREFVLRHAQAGLRGAVAGYAGEREAWRAVAGALEGGRGELGRELGVLGRYLTRRKLPFSLDMTVHEAWARHPGVRGVFTRHHLPACPACAVGVDETLVEAALGHHLDPDALLTELNTLLGS